MTREPKLRLVAAALLLALAAGSACSFRRFAVNRIADAVAGSGDTYASDDDPDLVRDALPFALKLTESLLAESPEHVGLLTSAASGFTQYAYAFVQQDADEADDTDFELGNRLHDRARKLYLRARGYAMRGLGVRHPGMGEALLAGGARADEALAGAETQDVELLYWAASSWALAISLAKDDPEMLAGLGAVDRIIHRALALDADWGAGSLHEFMIVFEGSRSAAMGGSLERARGHFERAVALSGGLRASPYVTYAEVVSVRNQDRGEFVSLLKKALAVDPGARPGWRLSNLIMQRRARWLLGREDRLFAD
ncbi:MAG TPA: TRAP transporter TatT component family protein [Candidatus Saccharimonadales bacterium]|nr:TRAP transporter TatT component family protein [Candidatus Saccharimonadales bacterium]